MDKTAEKLKLDRIVGKEVSERTYYNLIGMNIAYGFIVNMLMVAFLGDFARHINPFLFIICYFISCFAGTAIMANSNTAIKSFLGYNLLVVPVGLLIASALPDYNINDIAFAFGETLVITIIMIIVANIKPEWFENLGKVLLISLLVFIIVELTMGIFGFFPGWMDFICVGIFTLYIGYDWSTAHKYHKSACTATLVAASLYLDIINIFLRLLNIKSSSD